MELLWLVSMATVLTVSNSQLVPALFFFGASMLDVGSNNFLNYTTKANFFPYGETFFHRPTGRHSNGLILSDLLGLKLGFPLLPTYLDPDGDFTLGANFASAGSGILDDTSLVGETVWLPVIPLSTQVQQFEQLLHRHDNLRAKVGDSLVVINAGTNDLLQEIFYNQHTDMSSVHELVQLLIQRLKFFMEKLYRLGARKFLIIGLNPSGDQPSLRPYASNSLSLGDRLFDNELESMTSDPGNGFKDAEFIFFDMYNLFIDMIGNGSKYGFLETTKNCFVTPSPYFEAFLCDDPSVYLYWDGHPTQRGYECVVDAIWSGPPSLAWPFNLQTFLQSEDNVQYQ